MEILQIVFGNFLINFLGLNTRFYFFKIFDSNLRKEDFTKENEKDPGGIMQGIYNVSVGLVVFIILAVLIAYIFYLLKLL